jgi:hypothetical protein
MVKSGVVTGKVADDLGTIFLRQIYFRGDLLERVTKSCLGE